MTGSFRAALSGVLTALFLAVASPAFAQTCLAPPSGALSWWPAEGSADDEVGPRHGLLRGGAVFAPGRVGEAFALDGVDDFIDLGTGTFFQNGTAMTIEGWVNPSAGYGSNYRTIVYTSTNAGWWLQTIADAHGGGVRFGVAFGSGGTFIDAPARLPAETWTHLAATYDRTAGQLRLYVNGVLAATGASTAFINDAGLSKSIGRYPSPSAATSDYYFQGRIDELTIYARALSEADVDAIHDAGAAGKCRFAETALSITSAAGVYGGTAALRAMLTASALPAPGRTIAFRLGGTFVGSAVTDAAGVATLDVDLSGWAAGLYIGAVAAAFAGDSAFAASGDVDDLLVAKATPAVTWVPGPLTYGTPLGGAHLNATASVDGEFAYSPGAGTVLSAGPRWLSVNFTPDDTANFEAVQKDVLLTVATADQTIAWQSFFATGSMATARESVAIAPLPDGALVAGGYNFSWLRSAERYSNASGVFSAAGGLPTERSFIGDGAAVLADGRVLVAGGSSGGAGQASAVVYNPADGSWHATGDLKLARFGNTMTTLPDGRVLVTGGVTSSTGQPLKSAEIYDPRTGEFSAIADMKLAHFGHTATLLRDGTVLIAGSRGATASRGAEIFDPATGEFSLVGSMVTARGYHAAVLLDDGTVLISGGYDGQALAAAEIYDPTSRVFLPTDGLDAARYTHSATRLPGGDVLIVGGDGAAAVAEVYRNGQFVRVGRLMEARAQHGAVMLSSGNVLIAGGYGGPHRASAELYVPTHRSATDAPFPVGAVASTGLPVVFSVSGACALSGTMVTITGPGSCAVTATQAGNANYNPASFTQTYTIAAGAPDADSDGIPDDLDPDADGDGAPETNTWTAGERVPLVRLGAAAGVIDGKLVIASGLIDGSTRTPSTVVYDPTANTWADGADMPTPRYAAASGVIDGRLYVAGGAPSGNTGQVHAYDAAADSWTTVTPLPAPRGGMAGAVHDGRFYVFGGRDQGNAIAPTVYVYDPYTGPGGTWGTRHPLPTPRDWPGAATIEGRIYVVGGRTAAGTALNVVEAYDPVSDTWASMAPMPHARAFHGAVAVEGLLYVLGGEANGVRLTAIDVYDPRSNTWTTLPQAAPAAHSFGSFGAIGRAIHAVGGYDAAGVISAVHDVLRLADLFPMHPFFADTDRDGTADDVDADDDGDGIADALDVEQATHSNRFADLSLGGVTSGRIFTRAGRTVTVVDDAGGVQVTVTGGGGPATLTTCANSGAEVVELDGDGEVATVECVDTTGSLTGSKVTAVAATVGSPTPDIVVMDSLGSLRAHLEPGEWLEVGSPVTAGAGTILVEILDASGAAIGSFALDAGESVDVSVVATGSEIEVTLDVVSGTIDATVFDRTVRLEAGETGTFAPIPSVADLVETVSQLGLPRAITRALTVTLRAAEAALARGNVRAARAVLGVCVLEVRALKRSRRLDAAAADALIADLNAVIARL